MRFFAKALEEWFEIKLPDIETWDMLRDLLKKPYFTKPVVLILDEFDALQESFIDNFSNQFRDMYIRRLNESDKPSGEKKCLLHGLALIGVRTVLGIENVSGSPFNVQRSLRIPNLTRDEVCGMFNWYEKETGHKVETGVVDLLYGETQGQPGLTCWFGELLTEGFYGYSPEKDKPITVEDFQYIYPMAVQALPNNNILNIVSKAKQEPYRDVVLKLFKTDRKIVFQYDKSPLNFLYLNGATDIETTTEGMFVKFSSPFVQKRLFNYFSDELFDETGTLYEPFEDLGDTLTEESLNVENLVKRFESYLKENRKWLLKNAPRRKYMRIFEAVYHFLLYRFIFDFLGTGRARVWPEFPTGNGKVDIIVNYGGRKYALEVKSYTDETGYKKALRQAAGYGVQLGLEEIALVFFVESIDDANREKYGRQYSDETTGVRVTPIFVETST